MKSLIAMTALVLGICSQAMAENKALEVEIYGGFAGFDSNGYQAVRSTIAHLLANGVITQFKTLSVGLEGGGKFCIEASHMSSDNADVLMNALKPIQLNKKTTLYSLTAIESCQ